MLSSFHTDIYAAVLFYIVSYFPGMKKIIEYCGYGWVPFVMVRATNF